MRISPVLIPGVRFTGFTLTVMFVGAVPLTGSARSHAVAVLLAVNVDVPVVEVRPTVALTPSVSVERVVRLTVPGFAPIRLMLVSAERRTAVPSYSSGRLEPKVLDVLGKLLEVVLPASRMLLEPSRVMP